MRTGCEGSATSGSHPGALGQTARVPHTLVTFHAHPDDESLLTAGVMAKAVADGHRVVLVVATAGEVGQVADGFLGRDETLGARRSAELAASAAALGVHRVVQLGYVDSGHDAGAAPEGAFATAPAHEAARRLADVLLEEQADVLTVYDPHGGYGHPDHLRVHEVGYAAAHLAGTPVVLEATFNRDLMRMGAELAAGLGYKLPPQFSPAVFDEWFLAADELTHAVDVSAFLDAKRASMTAHASQSTGVGDTARSLAVFLSIPEEYFALGFGTEWFVQRGVPVADPKLGDVFATLDADGAGDGGGDAHGS
jgi:LmbE family N-acetylglucosaminyl deacetylase